ncbi:MAG: thioredoxin family protein [Candidatus Zixiibacteriota bacterium]|nr:MAG: thioredoxin family protein [candidate division Zixibacteria bacterium]
MRFLLIVNNFFKSLKLYMLAGIAFALFFNNAVGQDAAEPDAQSSLDPVAVKAYSSKINIAGGEKFEVAINLSIDEEWHINSNAPLQDYLIPTEIQLGESPFSLERIEYPDGELLSFAFSPDEKLSVYGGDVWIALLIKAEEGVLEGEVVVPLSVRSQACNDRYCLAPETQDISFTMTIDHTDQTAVLRHPSIFNAHGISGSETAESGTVRLEGERATGFWAGLKYFDAEEFVGSYGYILAYIAMYILGLGLTLTPCVYPIIPITIGYFGSQSQGNWGRQFAVAVIYGIGIAISYATVGTIAALSGSLMGAALQNVLVLIGLAALCTAMGLNAFGMYELRLPGWLVGLAGGGARKGYVGAAIMGLTMGIASAPCLAAFIISLLAFIGQKGDPILGFSMFLVLGLGLATPFIFLGTFSGMVNRIPRSGAWMVYAKKLMGSLLFAAALYFLHTVIPYRYFSSLVLIGLVAAGLYFGFFENSPARSIIFRAVRLTIAAIFIGIAFWWGMPESDVSSGPKIDWKPYSEELIKERGVGVPIVIDFYADWCIPCKELDRFSFSDPRVVEISREFLMLKSDLTRENSPEVKELISEFGIRGVPTIVLIGADGKERKDLRIVQFEDADEVLSRLKKIGGTGS